VFAIGWFSAGCAGWDGLPISGSESLRISHVADEGDPQRRASTRLLLVGLDHDAAGATQQARSAYDRALQVDPTNPYAYLVTARHFTAQGEPERAHSFLTQATARFDVQQSGGSRVEAHLIGLRGEAYYLQGEYAEAYPFLEQARELDPEVWGDGHLSAEELR
jgi:tetratricopeptide (TPR) repeat protein